MSEQNLFRFIRNFRALNGGPVAVASIHSHDLLLVMVIEIKSYAKYGRGINHATSLVRALCTAEDMHNGGHALFSHYRITENEKMVCSDFKEGGNYYIASR